MTVFEHADRIVTDTGPAGGALAVADDADAWDDEDGDPAMFDDDELGSLPLLDEDGGEPA